jgi:hypothetical protein
MLRIIGALSDCLADLPDVARRERADMGRHLILQMCAEYERALDEGLPTVRGSWQEMSTGLVDGLVGLWTAPVTS